MLRAIPTRWFDVITTRTDYARAMEQLARSGAVQLEAKSLDEALPPVPDLQRCLDTVESLEKQYGTYWPAPDRNVHASLDDPTTVIEETLTALESWARAADPLIARLQTFETRRSELATLKDLIAVTGADYPLAQLSPDQHTGLARAVYFISAEMPSDHLPANVLYDSFPTADGKFIVAIGTEADVTQFRNAMNTAKSKAVTLPSLPPATRQLDADTVDHWVTENDRELGAARNDLDALSTTHRLSAAIAQVSVLTWLRDNTDGVSSSTRTVRITGWTTAPSDDTLRRYLDETNVNYVLSISESGADANPPMVLKNPSWAKAFEFFPRMLGVPGRDETDPSMITAFVAPLMFGFMFGDVGQGAVLVAAGVALKNRMPLLALLIPGGISAMVFGVLFGSVFSREDVIPALWLHPLHEPITVLAVALIFGAALLVFGLILDAIQALWRHAGLEWLMTTGGIAFTYVSLLFAYWVPALVWCLAIGAIWTILGFVLKGSDGPLRAAVTGLAEFAESLMRLLVNSFSFARIGAFALAHAGLSSAIIGVGEAAGSVGYWIVLILGNLLIICLEGLVTGIQTTRLVLFEFFIRFFKAGGREFHPLNPPALASRNPLEM